MVMEDGSSRYVRLGKELHRFAAPEIDIEVEDFNKSIEEAEIKEDPLGLTSESKVFGNLSELKKWKLLYWLYRRDLPRRV